MPKVTVIIPAFNSERFIRSAIDSVLGQTYRDFEIVVVDDGSDDGTAEIAESYHDPVRCIRKAKGGTSSARNFGILDSTSEYIAFLDSDDLWLPHKLERQIAVLEANPDIGLCYVAIEQFGEGAYSRVEADEYPDYCEALLLYSCIVTGSCSSVMMRRNLIEKIGVFDTNLTNFEDWEFWLRLSLVTKFAPIQEFLVRIRVVRGSASSNSTRIIEQNVRAALAKFFSLPNLPEKYRAIKNKSYSNTWLMLTGSYLDAGDVLKIAGWRTDTITFIAASDIVVQPTLTEAFSQVMGEAMWMSKPLIITDVSGATDIIKTGENGVLVPKANSKALADSIINLFKNPELRWGIGKNGREYVEEHLIISTVIKMYEASYYKTVGM